MNETPHWLGDIIEGYDEPCGCWTAHYTRGDRHWFCEGHTYARKLGYVTTFGPTYLPELAGLNNEEREEHLRLCATEVPF